MPFIRSSAFKYRLRLVSLILSLGKIILSCSCYIKKRLSYIIISTPFGYQSFFYAKYTKLNMRLSCDIKLVSNTKYACLMHSYILQSLRLSYLIYLRVLYSSICRKT